MTNSTQDKLADLTVKIVDTSRAIQEIESALIKAPDEMSKVVLNVQARTLRLELSRYNVSREIMLLDFV